MTKARATENGTEAAFYARSSAEIFNFGLSSINSAIEKYQICGDDRISLEPNKIRQRHGIVDLYVLWTEPEKLGLHSEYVGHAGLDIVEREKSERTGCRGADDVLWIGHRNGRVSQPAKIGRQYLAADSYY